MKFILDSKSVFYMLERGEEMPCSSLSENYYDWTLTP